MNENLLRTDTFEISDLISMALSGDLRVPNFQRSFRWKYDDAVKLFDSIFKAYPLGNILLWDRERSGKEDDEFRLGELTIRGNAGSQSNYWIVDGQQRLTTMLNCLSEEGYRSGWKVVYNIEEDKVELANSNSLSSNQVPLYIIFDISKLFDWLQANPDLVLISSKLTEKNKQIRQFRIPVSIVKTNDEKILREIFDRLNNAGKRLTRFEVFNALQPNEINEESLFSTKRLSEDIYRLTTFGEIDEGTLVSCIKVLTNPDYSRDVRSGIEDTSKTGSNKIFIDAKDNVIKAIKFMQNYCNVPHSVFIPYNYTLIILTRFMKYYPEISEEESRSLARWFWKNTLNGPSNGANSAEGRNLAKMINGDKSATAVINDFHSYESSKRREINEFPSAYSFKTNSASGKAMACAYFSLEPYEITIEDEEMHKPITKEKISNYLGSSGKKTLNSLFLPLAFDRNSIDPDLRNTLGARYLTATDENIDKDIDLNSKSQNFDIMIKRHMLSGDFKPEKVDAEYINERNIRINEIFSKVFRDLAGLNGQNISIDPISSLEME